jgi:hypothetical protein
MAFAGNNRNVNYTPFNKVSFGYSNVLSSYTSVGATDIVEIKIRRQNGITSESHISTPAYGSAISTYNKNQRTWRVKGQKNDVDQVLNQIYYYPETDTNYLNWQVQIVPYRVNYYTQLTQSPPNITDRMWYLTAYEDDGTYIGEEWVTFVEQSDYVYYHPYMTSALPNETMGTGTNGITTLDLGTIGTANMDGRNITVTCEAYTSFTQYPTSWSNSTNNITFYDVDMYIGDKKTETRQGVEKFRFTGSIEECQSLLNNIECNALVAGTYYLKISLLDGLTVNQYSKQITAS